MSHPPTLAPPPPPGPRPSLNFFILNMSCSTRIFDTHGVSCYPGIGLRTREQFLSCVDSSLNNAKSNSVVQLFRPLFNVSIVAEAYNDLCNNLTGRYQISNNFYCRRGIQRPLQQPHGRYHICNSLHCCRGLQRHLQQPHGYVQSFR